MDGSDVSPVGGTAAATAGIQADPKEVFLAPRRTWLFMGGAFGALSLMLVVTVGLGGMAAVRLAAARLLGINPAWLVDDSYDLALLTWGLGLTGLAALTHPAVGIAALLLLRPWIDGYTFPSDNYYFAFGAQFIGLVRLLQRRRDPSARFDGLLPALLLGGFALTGLVTLPFTWQVHATARQLIIWQAALLLFVTAADVSTDRNARRIILGSLAAAVFLEAVFSILHFKYLLPYLRVLILENKAVLRQFFGTDQITPELARRFNYNRAFGSMLFPNALSAFLILGLPVLGAGAWRFWRGGDRPEKEASSFRVSAAVGVGAGVGAFTLAMMITHFVSTYRRPPVPWYCEVPWQILWAFLAAAPVAGGLFAYARTWGAGRSLHDLARVVFPVAVLAGLAALYYTFSRGGWLGLALACVACAVVFGWPARARASASTGGRPGGAGGKGRVRGKRARVVLPFVVAAGLLAFGGVERAAGQAKGPSGSARVTEEGIGVGLQELSDPSSFRLRFTYWRVGLSMFAHNALTGVGMGNFMEAYSEYQYLGAGDVREAHNGYLQAFCETGIVGGALFCGFWGLIALGSAWRLRRNGGPDPLRQRPWDVALWTGLCAFLLHAAVDIHFSHPSLVMTVAAMAGVLWVGSGASEEETAREQAGRAGKGAKERRAGAWARVESMILGGWGRWALIGALVVSSVASAWTAGRVLGMELRFNGMKWLNVADSKTREKLLQVGEFFLKDVFQHAMAHEKARQSGQPAPSAPKLPFVDALSLQPDLEVWLPCAFYEPVPGSNQYRPLPEGVFPSRQCMIGITKPWRAYFGALDGMLALTARLEAVDATWPWNPEAARYIAEWYGLLYRSVYDPGRREAGRATWRDKWLAWSRRAMERNPMNPEAVRYHAEVLAGLALNDETWQDAAGRVKAMETCLELHRKTVRYAPQNARFQFNTAWALEQLAKLYRQSGREAEAGKIEQEAVQIRDNAQRLQQLRFSMGFSY
ncbi:MAG TPA: O-antigen ligase family protein [Candidatus Hydrogenedentes bacterium]|nr:O-antigen ligase family protein [Candidatus Hydrogenedentota bacterium]